MENIRKVQEQFRNTKYVHEMVFLTLRECILQGILPSGTPMLEEMLAEALCVSRTPLRTAMYRLAAEELLEQNRSEGFAVKRFSPRDCLNIVETFDLITTATTRRMVGKLPLTYSLLLRKNLEQARKSLEVGLPYTLINEEFHLLIVNATSNDTLLNIAQKLFNQMRMIAQNICPITFTEDSILLHEAILDGLESGDMARTDQALGQHQERSKAYSYAILSSAFD